MRTYTLGVTQGGALYAAVRIWMNPHPPSSCVRTNLMASFSTKIHLKTFKYHILLNKNI